MTLNSLHCAEVPLRNCSLTHSPTAAMALLWDWRCLQMSGLDIYLHCYLFTSRSRSANTASFSRSYCYTVWLAIGVIMSSVCGLCDVVHCGSQGQCTGLKVVPACS